MFMKEFQKNNTGCPNSKPLKWVPYLVTTLYYYFHGIYEYKDYKLYVYIHYRILIK